MNKSQWISEIILESEEMILEKKSTYLKKTGKEPGIKEGNGLWDNIHKKRKRGGKPAKKGQKGYPSDKAWKELTEEDEIEEGNAFISAASKAASKGQKTFTVDDEEYPTKMSKAKGEEIQQETMLRKFIRKGILEALHNGKEVTLNKPTSNSENPKKKSKVYVSTGEKYKSGENKGKLKAKKVQFGDPNMRIRKSNPKARKSFRARHKCSEKKPKDTAGYWSCKAW